MKDMILLRKVE